MRPLLGRQVGWLCGRGGGGGRPPGRRAILADARPLGSYRLGRADTGPALQHTCTHLGGVVEQIKANAPPLISF